MKGEGGIIEIQALLAQRENEIRELQAQLFARSYTGSTSV